jgi:TRAP-type uncharacterized transport system substrate-binding protein
MKKSLQCWLGYAALMIASSAFANPGEFLISAASSSGTYKLMLGEIKKFCDDEDFTIKEIPNNGGATENLEALVNNTVSAAFLHSDVIYAMAQADSKYRNYKTLVNLYGEDIHVLALRIAKEKTGGVAGYGATPVVYSTLADLANRNIGAAGGSVITARILTGQGEGHFNVVPFDDGKDVIEALTNGHIQAAIFVGGSPLPNLAQLNATDFKLLPLGDAIASKVSGVYRPATINYTNLKSGPIKTLAASAIILTRQYKTPKMIAPQARFRECFYNKLDELRETPGTHKKWQEIDPSDHGVWEWYDLPAASPATPEAPETKKK